MTKRKKPRPLRDPEKLKGPDFRAEALRRMAFIGRVPQQKEKSQ